MLKESIKGFTSSSVKIIQTFKCLSSVACAEIAIRSDIDELYFKEQLIQKSCKRVWQARKQVDKEEVQLEQNKTNLEAQRGYIEASCESGDPFGAEIDDFIDCQLATDRSIRRDLYPAERNGAPADADKRSFERRAHIFRNLTPILLTVGIETATVLFFS